MNNDSTSPASASSRLGLVIRMILGTGLAIYGLSTEDAASMAWTAVALTVYGLPLLLQFTPWPLLRAYSLWVGVFVAAQSLLTHALRGDYLTLPPNMQRTVQATRHDIPGYAAGMRRISTDERGYRVTPKIDYSSRQGFRVVAIGGSTTEEVYLDDESTWTHRLQDALAQTHPGAHVINTGVSGLRAANHVATLREIAGLAPDLVIIMLGANDWNKHVKDHFEARREAWRPPALRYTIGGMALDAMVLSPLRRWLTGRSWADTDVVVGDPAVLYMGEQLAMERVSTHSFRPDAVAPWFAEDLRRLGAICSERRLRCLFMTQPNAYRDDVPADLKDRLWMTPPFATYAVDLPSMMHVARVYNEHIAAFARRGGHGLCDVASQLPARREFLFDDVHFTDTGAMRMSEIVLACVRPALAARPD